MYLYNNFFMILPVIVCIAKKEHDYIEEFIKYHLALGFAHIFLYDNEEVPTYENMLQKYKQQLTVIHIPNNNYVVLDVGCIPVQYFVLNHFVENILFNSNITHVAHIDIDEFVVLKKHNNICDFINEYIIGDCQGIGMNWRFFGSSGKTEKTNEPVTFRFTMCENNGNAHIKTIFKKEHFVTFNTCHDVMLREGCIKSTNGNIIKGHANDNIDFSIIQLNHYKCKTLPEYRYIRQRGRADQVTTIPENVDEDFKNYDINEIEDLTAKTFYQSIM